MKALSITPNSFDLEVFSPLSETSLTNAVFILLERLCSDKSFGMSGMLGRIPNNYRVGTSPVLPVAS